MSLLKYSKEELKDIASTSDVWSVYIRMKEMMEGIPKVDFRVDWDTTSRFNQIPTGFSLDAEYTNADGEPCRITLKQTGDAPPTISTHVNLVVQLARLTNRTIEEINKESYFSNKKLIKKLDKVVYLGREYLKAYREAYSGIPPKWLDNVIAGLKWVPNANLRILGMLKAAKKMEKALEGIKEHLEIDLFEIMEVDGGKKINLTFRRLSDEVDIVTLENGVGLLSSLIVVPIDSYLDQECPELPKEDKRRILQSRVAVLALIQIKPLNVKAFEAVNQAVLAVMQA